MTKLEKAIKDYGYDTMHKWYIESNQIDFAREYRVATSTLIKVFGPKGKLGKKPPKEEPKIPTIKEFNIREGIKQDRWEYKEEKPKWEGEIRTMGYLRTSLLP